MLARLHRFFRRFRKPERRCRFEDQAAALAVLERDRLITRGEAHALRAGEQLADLYAEIHTGEVGVDAETLDEVEHQLRIGNLPEALVQLARLHPALADLPDLYTRSTGRGA